MYTLHPVTELRVVLTIAHLDHMPEHNDRFNLRAWCQRCHLNYDKAHHAETTTQDGSTRIKTRINWSWF